MFIWAALLLLVNGGTTTDYGWGEERRGDEWFVTRVDPAGPAADSVRVGDRVVGGERHP